ncbi:hypothetical protein LguiB_003752 [Lonicera macranthoides]
MVLTAKDDNKGIKAIENLKWMRLFKTLRVFSFNHFLNKGKITLLHIVILGRDHCNHP